MTIQSKRRTLLRMKVQASGILILIACILTGCGKSMEDVAGVYETAEIKEPQSSGSYYSTTWVLDLAESGTFTLKENKLRKFREGKTHEPVPMDGIEESGGWSLNDSRVTITFNPFVPLEVGETRNRPIEAGIPFAIQSTGDLVSEMNWVGGGNTVDGVFNTDLLFLHRKYDIKGLRFKRVE